MRHLLHFRVFVFQDHLVRAGQIFFDLLEFAMLVDDFRELRMLLGKFLEARGIGDSFGRRKLLRHFFVAIAKLVEFFRERKC